MNSKEPTVVILILNWNKAPDTCECVDSLLKMDYINYKIVLIDNGSEDDSFDVLSARYSDVKNIVLMRNRENLGFTGGNNTGIKRAIKDNAEFVFLLNNDTIVDEKVILELLKPFENPSGRIIATPKIYSYYHKNILWSAGGEFDSAHLKVRMFGCGEKDGPAYDVAKECTFATGCALFTKTEAFKENGLFDESLFHSGEDLAFSIKATSSGYKILYVPSARVWHKEMLSTGAGGRMTPLATYYEFRNKLIVFHDLGYLRSFFVKLMLLFRYVKYSFSVLLKQVDVNVFMAIYVAIFDFFLKKRGKISYPSLEKRWLKK